MTSARPAVRVCWTRSLLVLAMCCLPAGVAAQSRPAVLVVSITVDGKPVAMVDGVRVTAPGQARAEAQVLRAQDPLSPGSVIEVPDRTVVTLSTLNGTELTLQPGSRTKLNAVTDRGESFTQLLGETWFKVLRVFDFFEVTHERFLAAVKGTEFKVSVDARDIQFEWIAGQIEVTRDVRVMIAGAAQRDVVAVTEVVSAEHQQVRHRRDVEEYLRDFNSYQDLEAYFRSQLAEDEASGDQVRILEGLTNLGTALVTVGKPTDAIPYHERSLALHLEAYPDGVHPAIAGDYGKLGIAYGDLGQPRQAIEWYERSVELLLKIYPDGVHPDIAVNYTNLGVQYGKTGDSRKAVEYYEQSLALLPRLYPNLDDSTPQPAAALAMAANLGNLGVEYGRLKDHPRAVDYFERSLALHRQLHPAGVHPDIAVDYVNLGVQYVALGDLRRAVDAYDQSLTLLLQIYPDGVHPYIAVVYRNLSRAWRALGDVARAADYATKEQDVTAKLTR